MAQRTAAARSGMRAFTIVWFGQLVSLTGTAMTQFAIGLWAWELTGQATALALAGFFTFAPTVLFSPIAGALVDRWNRKLVMMFSDMGAGAAALVLLLLYATGSLQIWHIYLAGAFAGMSQAFQFPAYSAAISTMIPKSQYTRADAMLGLAESASAIFAPLLAGALYAIIGLGGIMTIDVATFLVALAALFVVHIPQPPITEAGRHASGGLWQESVYGFRYIFARPSLLGLQLVFLVGNLAASASFVLITPMLLARTNSNEVLVGSVQSAFGVGGVLGGIALSAWGGPQRRVHGVLAGWALSGLWTFFFGFGQSVIAWIAIAFAMSFTNPVINASNQAIWQSKVAPDVQGRVFATRRMIAQMSGPLGILAAGPLADQVFGPALMPGGSLASSLGGVLGVGPGAGMGLMIVLCGAVMTLAGLIPYSVTAVREVETLLPDHAAPHA